MLEAYRNHVAERAAQAFPPKPLNAEQVAALVELLKNPPAGEERLLVDLISNRVPPGVDEAAYVKAGFLSAIVKGEAQVAADRQATRRETAGQDARRLQHRDTGGPARRRRAGRSWPRTNSNTPC